MHPDIPNQPKRISHMVAAQSLEALIDQVRDFIDHEVIPLEEELDRNGDRVGSSIDALKSSAKDKGLWAIGHPREIGGRGLNLHEFAYVNEIIGRSHWGQVAVGSVSMQDSIMLHKYGTEAQKEQWLIPIVRGDMYPSVGLTEPDVAGSDPTLMRTTASLDREDWVISGRKWFVSGADRSGFITVFCRTEDAGLSPSRQMSAIICPRGTPGLEIVRAIDVLGLSSGAHGSACEVTFNNVRVSRDFLLGERGQGMEIAQKRLGAGRIFHCMRWLGQAQRAFELMCERAQSRYAHGSLLAEKGDIRRMIAESAIDIQAARLLTLNAAAIMDQEGDSRIAISMVKCFAAEMLHRVIDRAVQVHGALGVSADSPLSRMYREARLARIMDGPDEVHRSVVARALLRDPTAAPWLAPIR
jgi:acyl-CoA dehydrogenase